jgi:hypothetical protein
VASQEALEKPVQLSSGGSSFDWFFLAMTHRQLGEKELAHQWYTRTVAWMDKNHAQNDELRRFRAEATALLGVKEESSTKAKEVSRRKE